MKPSSPFLRALLTLAALVPSGPGMLRAAAPVANDDHVVATDRYLEVVGGVEQYAILIDVLANDHDADGDPLEVVVDGAPWAATPVGTILYFGGGVFELDFGKEEIGDATEVTFQYELEGGSQPATVRVSVSGEGPAPDAIARDDVFDEPWACRLELPVLANDTGLDEVLGFDPPEHGVVERHPADPNLLVYRGGIGGSFTYTARSSTTGAVRTATVVVQEGNDIGTKSAGGDIAPIAMADCFDREDGTALDGQHVTYHHGPQTVPPLSWNASGITHLDESATTDAPLGGSSVATRTAFAPFFTGNISGSAYEIRATFQADATSAEWMAVAFSHGAGTIPAQGDLWVRLDVETGELFLRACCDGSGPAVVLGNASPVQDGYPFVAGEPNYLRLRYDTEGPVSHVDLWMNGTRVFSRVPLAGLTLAVENVGYSINYGTRASDPGDVWFDDFELRVGDVEEAVLQPKAGDPDAGLDVENGSTLDIGPVHIGCTSEHSDCSSTAESSIWLTNNGTETLAISNLSFEGTTAWTLVTPSIASFSIEPGEQAEVGVRVDAREVGTTVSHLELSTNDPDLPKLTVNFEAEAIPAPMADFVHYCEGLSCVFDGHSSTGVGLSDFSYLWTLNGTTQFGPSFDPTFTESGVHEIELRVTDLAGASHRLERTIGILPEAAFVTSCVNATRACDFDAALTSDGVASYTYRFGDGIEHQGLGDPGDVLLTHTYATSGRYDVTLTIHDEAGQEASASHEVVLLPVVDFTVTCAEEATTCAFDAALSSPDLTLYEWSFGDGSFGTGLQTEHSYATSGIYTVSLTVVDRAGQIDSLSKVASVPPRADFTVVQCVQESRTCSFDGSGSTPGVTFSWDFGDGAPTGTGATPSHTYATSGIFDVTLTVTDGSGQTVSASRTVSIQPIADFTATCDGLLCGFDASPSSPGVIAWAWAFGHDAATGTGASPSHAFPTDEEYEVSLTVTDGSGQTASTTRAVTVSDEGLLLLILLGRR